MNDRKMSTTTIPNNKTQSVESSASNQATKDEKPLKTEEPLGGEPTEIPDHLGCPLCFDLIIDAVTTWCCGRTYCDGCVRKHLNESDTCPIDDCKEVLSDEKIRPNQSVRKVCYIVEVMLVFSNFNF